MFSLLSSFIVGCLNSDRFEVESVEDMKNDPEILIEIVGLTFIFELLTAVGLLVRMLIKRK